ncbi:MAG: hypothetical protein COV66_07620 [Nitrospinae bacterium CG11_big_fil_rev_8_21_14_0_20_45_15]|nr:MAG: hypothetical protein COV66_07620 [Nitrospinae bacterium CG11_big_fil_rev_8_21_14_0_20_45_15]
MMYRDGLGVTKDYKEAVKWFRKAAEQGFARGQAYLGAMYFDGEGVPKDDKEAVKWLRKAAEQGDILALNALRKITQKQKETASKPQRPIIVASETILVKTAGTGFTFGSSGYILTNYHVVKDAKQIKVRFLNGENVLAKLVIKDEANDVAFIKPEHSPNLPGANISLGNSSAMRIGDKVFTIGFPISHILGQQPRYSEGVINSLSGVRDDPKAFQVSIPIQSGNSGGPLFNERGEVVGIVSSSLDSANTFQLFGNAPQNVNFAIKSTFVKNLIAILPETLIAPTSIVVIPRESGSRSDFISRVQNNIVLIEAEY